MSFLAIMFAAFLLFTGALVALTYPRVLVVHAVIVAGWLACEYPLRAAEVAGLAVLVALVAVCGVRFLAAGLAEVANPQIPWSRAERLQRRVRRLTLDGDETGFGQEWATFAARRGLRLADSAEIDASDRPNPAADPGNPGRLIATWTCPLLARRRPEQGRYLLLMVDASPHRHRRRFLGLVPVGAPADRYGLYGEIATDPDPLTAQANSWRVPRHVYAATRRAT